jgi:hypothetical protein
VRVVRPVGDVEQIGYWRPPERWYDGSELWESVRRFPDVRNFVDADWDPGERRVVADYLARGTLVNQYRGLSTCRFCGRNNGSAEITDGAYCWPEGLAHYVNEHAVRLPGRFVTHVHKSMHRLGNERPPKFDSRGMRDRDWRPSASMTWEPKEDRELSDGYFCCYVNNVWWLQCQRP